MVTQIQIFIAARKMNGIIPVQSNLQKNKNIFYNENEELPGEKCVVKHVVAVYPQIGLDEVDISYVDSLKVGQIHINIHISPVHISPVLDGKLQLEPLGYIDGYSQECAGQNIDDQVDSRGVAGSINNIISGIISDKTLANL